MNWACLGPGNELSWLICSLLCNPIRPTVSLSCKAHTNFCVYTLRHHANYCKLKHLITVGDEWGCVIYFTNLLDSNKLLSVFDTQKYSLIESLLLKLFLHARFPLWHPQRDSTFFLIFRAHSLDPDDSEVLFHLALCQALMRQVNFIYRLLSMIASVFHWSKPLLTLTLLLNCSRSFSRALSSLVSWLVLCIACAFSDWLGLTSTLVS